MIVNGFCKEVFKELPMEFAVEAQQLLGISSKEASVEAVRDAGRSQRKVRCLSDAHRQPRTAHSIDARFNHMTSARSDDREE